MSYTNVSVISDLMERIYTRQGEISELVDRVMEEKAAREALNKPRVTFQQTEPTVVIEPPTPADDVTVAPLQAEVKSQQAPATVRLPVKRSRSTLQRMLHAVRKRLRRSPTSGAEHNTT